MTRGRDLYERYRRREIDALHWNWLDQTTRDFWERLAMVLASV